MSNTSQKDNIVLELTKIWALKQTHFTPKSISDAFNEIFKETEEVRKFL